MYIATREQLCTFIESIKGVDAIAVDTEFMREKTYYAKLCLIQIAAPGVVAVIDPLAIKDLSPLIELFCESDTLKIFHSGSQDLEIFYQLFNKPVAPIFDTQSAAALIGLRTQVGYQELVETLLGVKLSKADSYTDWSRRPLHEAQISYAREDVIYLLQLYPELIERMRVLKRDTWLDSEFKTAASAETYQVDPRQMYKRVKKIGHFSRRKLALAREIAAWREELAQKQNIPRKWVLSDETLVEAVRRAPRTVDALKQLRGITSLTVANADGLFSAIARGEAVPESDLPCAKEKVRIGFETEISVDLMAALVRTRAKDNTIAMTQLAPRPDLERLALSPDSPNIITTGWRNDMVGKELVALLHGEIGLAIQDGNLVTITREVCAPNGVTT